MSLDRSLKSANALVRHRNVLTRDERLLKLKEMEKWNEGKSVFGLPKVANRKLVVGGKGGAKEEVAEGAAGAVAGATATGAAPAAGTAGAKAAAAATPAKGAAAPAKGKTEAKPGAAAGAAAPPAKGKK